MDTVVYVGSPHLGPASLGFGAAGEVKLGPNGETVLLRRNPPKPWRRETRFVSFTEPGAAVAYLLERPRDGLILDVRGEDRPKDFESSRAGLVLSRLFPTGESQRGAIRRDAVFGVVGEGLDAIQWSYEFGRRGIGAVFGVTPKSDSESVAEQLLKRLDGVLTRGGAGRVAICLAGGGIEGLFYEVGVLRALETFLADRAIVDFDFFCGISAGAVLGAFLANGVGPSEIARGLEGESSRIDPLTRMQLFDPNVREMTRRSFGLAKDLLRGGSGPRAVSSLTRAIPTGVFAGDGLRAWLERQLTKPGMSNRFDGLRRPLYVGATDQDTAQHVVFGDTHTRHVPIHRAVRASAALVPFYAPEQIEDRYYMDGAFSRTTNMRVAVDKGATMVILIDPLVPVFSREPGYVNQRGGMFATMQGLKALINGRFDKAVDAIREMHPDVSFHLFRPEAAEMRILSGSPMKYFYRTEVEEISFESTVRKLRNELPRLSRDFAAHGITFRDPEAQVLRVVEAKKPTRFDPGALGVDVS